MVWKKSLHLLLLVTFCIFAFSSVLVRSEGAVQGLAISPALLEVEAESGKSYDLDYTVENNTGVDNLSVDVSIETFKEGGLPGSANIVPFDDQNSLAYWLNVPTEQKYISGEKKKLSYQLTVPDKTQAGAYFFAIVYQPRQSEQKQGLDGSELILKTRIATLLFVNVGGDSSKQPTIEDYSLSQGYWIDPFFDRIDLNYNVKVQGNSFYRPSGNLFLTDAGSEKINTLSSFTSDRIILPGAKRAFQYCIKQKDSLAEKCEGESALTSLPLVGGRNIVLRLDFTDGAGNPQTVIAQKPVFFIPYKTTLVVLAFVLIWVILYRVVVAVKDYYNTKTKNNA